MAYKAFKPFKPFQPKQTLAGAKARKELWDIAKKLRIAGHTWQYIRAHLRELKATENQIIAIIEDMQGRETGRELYRGYEPFK